MELWLKLIMLTLISLGFGPSSYNGIFRNVCSPYNTAGEVENSTVKNSLYSIYIMTGFGWFKGNQYLQYIRLYAFR